MTSLFVEVEQELCHDLRMALLYPARKCGFEKKFSMKPWPRRVLRTWSTHPCAGPRGRSRRWRCSSASREKAPRKMHFLWDIKWVRANENEKNNLMQVGQKQVVGSVVHVQLLYQGVPARNAHHYLLEILLTSSNFQKLFLLFELVRQFTVPGHVFKSLDVVLVRRHE